MGEAANLMDKPARRKFAGRLLRVLALAYIAVALAVFLMQNYLIFPGASTHGRPDAIVAPGKHYELLWLQAHDGTKIAAIFGSALDSSDQTRPDANQRPTVIYLYGNGACIAYSMDVFLDFRERGFNVIIPEYEGYGMSQGHPSEAGCYAAADAAYDYLLTRPDIRQNKIVAVGWSLGGAVAIDLAIRKPVAGVVTLSAFTRMKDMAHGMLPWLPTSLLLRHHFDNIAKIPNLHCPILIAHGTRDSIVPPEMADRLAAAATPGTVTRLRVEGADHNDIFDTGGVRLFDQLQKFIDGL